MSADIGAIGRLAFPTAEHGGQQLVEGRHPAHVTACLHALRDNQVASSRLRGPALVGRANLPRHQSSPAVPSPDKALVRIAFEELGDLHPVGRFRYDLN